ncbi:hypothetical protein [Clostridium sp.]|uniref:hypothetical protein n=1 Tax=Clostridium sp. TaxID=1506 RepID=UPI00261B080E|nr:hypothetical protein [Clostridium sp.]
MKNYKDNDEDFKLVPMNIRCNTDYSFMPMQKKNLYKNVYKNMYGHMMNPYNYQNSHECCFMHSNNQMMYPNSEYGHYQNQSMFMPNNMDDIMVKTFITVKQKSDLFD